MATTQSRTEALPTPRQLITSILNSLFTPPSSNLEEQQNFKKENNDVASTTTTSLSAANAASNQIKSEDDETPSNPLKTLSPQQRALLTTLHVLIPPPTLLQALDLLDRGLVSKVTWEKAESGMNTQSVTHGHRTVQQNEANDNSLLPSLSQEDSALGRKSVMK